jgi:pyruvate kinase
VDVFRLNASHGTHEDHARRFAILRDLERSTGHPIAVLMDLQGPKLRVGTFAEGRAQLQEGAIFRLDRDPAPGGPARVGMPHSELFAAFEPDADVLLDDGRIRLRVLRHGPDSAETVVLNGGILADRKGVNVPGVELPLSALSDKDRLDLAFALDLGVDWIGLSFVQRPQDVAEARALIGGRAGIIAKIEKPSAIALLEEIVGLSDAVMVARGDLGVELPPEDVPGLQKCIVRMCRALGRPVIVATQMLESMTHSPAPTRAEASDVATAVFDGADAVMLSAESATGLYPVPAVRMMDRIIRKVEREASYRTVMDAEHPAAEPTEADAITGAARGIAATISATAIATYTSSGSTTLRASRERPEVPILGLTTSRATARRLTLAWGVHPVHTEGPEIADFADMVGRASRAAVACGMASVSQRLVITAGVPFGTPGATNSLRVVAIGPESVA